MKLWSNFHGKVNFDATDIFKTALEIKGILSTAANFSVAVKFLSVALMIFAIILAVIILKEIYNNIVLAVFKFLKSIICNRDKIFSSVEKNFPL